MNDFEEILLQNIGDSISLERVNSWGAWMAWSVKRPTSAQVMISRSVNSSPTSGSVLTAQNLEPVLDFVSPCLSLFLPCSHTLSHSLSKINKV